MTPGLTPGLLVLHGNRLELLRDTVFAWLKDHPLAPLEEEYFLVQSNGVAEWLKMALATQSGICAAARMELPAQFIWRAYRLVLGPGAVPARSAFDKLPLTWRLMKLLPKLQDSAVYEPLNAFLRPGDMERQLQLALQLADLFDQYQVYRSDWLEGWARGHDRLPRGLGASIDAAAALPPGQHWQAALWRELRSTLDSEQDGSSRARLQQRFVAALDSGAPRNSNTTRLPRRVVLFGMAHLPMPTLEALAALSRHCQVLLAVPNPCRFHWADIIEGRQLLFFARKRHGLRQGRDLAEVSLDEMHSHAHPLLAAWGRQARDFVRQLDAFDDAVVAGQRFQLARLDLFDEARGSSLLQQVQAHIRDLLPLHEHPVDRAAAGDRSIVFHIAHSAQREVEILHDQLLALLAQPATDAALGPRDIVVMVPDIANFAAAIHSVFGQYQRADSRFIPYGISDLHERGHNALLVAVEWLLQLPTQRCGASEVRALLDVPAVAKRFGLDAADLALLVRWVHDSGIRWGLSAAHRTELGLATCGEQNTWLFGLRRLLLGYASGDAGLAGGTFQGIQPYPDIGGLDAGIAGSLAALVEALLQWQALATQDATPMQWAVRAGGLIDTFTAPSDERERLTVASLRDALTAWLEACDTADFNEPVTLAVLRQAWLSGVDAPGLNRRFNSGGVTFCTLLPLRAIPFEVVCLLGMNDGDYPRSHSRNDFDLMALPGLARPGDRSRRDDDRQLMLDALLAARRVLYISWVGRSVRDHSEQPPSVLVSQLRDYLAAGWQGNVLASRTTEHPLQPFSRRYFEAADGVAATQAVAAELPPALFTHSREWRAAHVPSGSISSSTTQSPLPAPQVVQPRTGFEAEALPELTLAALAGFLKNPAKAFFRQRLQVVFADRDDLDEDDEIFELQPLEETRLLSEVCDALGCPGLGQPLRAGLPEISALVDTFQAAGRLPIGAPGRLARAVLVDALVPMLACWHDLQMNYCEVLPSLPLEFEHDGMCLSDQLDRLRAPAGRQGQLVWLELLSGRLLERPGKPVPRLDRLIAAWVRCLVASACHVQVQGVLVGRDAVVTLQTMPADQATALLVTLLQAYRQGMASALPLAPKTGFAWLAGTNAISTVYEGGYRSRGEVEEPCLQRCFPDYEALSADGRFAHWATSLLGPLLPWSKSQVSCTAFPVHET